MRAKELRKPLRTLRHPEEMDREKLDFNSVLNQVISTRIDSQLNSTLEDLRSFIHTSTIKPRVMTIKELIDFLQMGNTQVYDLIKEPGFPLYNIGEKTFRVVDVEVLEWLRRNKAVYKQPDIQVLEETY